MKTIKTIIRDILWDEFYEEYYTDKDINELEWRYLDQCDYENVKPSYAKNKIKKWLKRDAYYSKMRRSI